MNDVNEIKKYMYEGMGIYKIIKDLNINVGNVELTLEDKKYLALYLGVMNNKLYNNKIKIFCNKLKMEEYMRLYELYFVDIFNEINFNDINTYIEYLLNNDIIKKYNEINKINYTKNKRLVKQII